MKKILTLIMLLMGQGFISNAQKNMTAENILEKSIEFCGGIENISKIKYSSLVYDLTIGDGSHASVIIKREIARKYMRSVLSEKHVPSCIYYNDSTVTVIDGEVKKVFSDTKFIEEIKLQTYNQPQYAYKVLSYSLKRLGDQKFNHFDCYVLSATAKSGYTTLNYFDKTNLRLIMVVYPKGNKSLLIDYDFKDGTLFNTKILNVEENSEQIILVLKEIDNNIIINPIWFSIGNSLSTSLPDNIRKGTFVSADNAVADRTESTQVEQRRSLRYTLSLAWFNNYTYVMVDNKSIGKKAPFQTGDNILVKIVNWDKEGYVCHYYSNGVSGTQEYKIKK